MSGRARRGKGSAGRGEAETAGLLRRLLEAVERGELAAGPLLIAFLAGALSALEAGLSDSA